MIEISIFKNTDKNGKTQWWAWSEDTNKDDSSETKYARNFSYVSEAEALGGLILFLLCIGYEQLANLKIVEGLPITSNTTETGSVEK